MAIGFGRCEIWRGQYLEELRAVRRWVGIAGLEKQTALFLHELDSQTFAGDRGLDAAGVSGRRVAGAWPLRDVSSTLRH
jgi:hypothetical protein